MSTNPALHEEDAVEDAARRLEGCPPEEVLAEAAARFGPRIAFATGFGPEGCVLLDVIARHRLPVEVLTLDTGLLFPETRSLWRRLEERYGLTIRGVRPRLGVAEQAARHGPRLWEREPDRCCWMRKVEPLAEALAGLDAWVTAIRREQTTERGDARILERDGRFGLVKVNPLAGWTHTQVWDYVRENDVPVNALHAHGYPSIGCWPCTTPVHAGEDPRAGRWRHREKTECGLHLRTSRSGRAQVLPLRGGARRMSTLGHEPVPDGGPALLPVFLRLAGRRVVVVGAGAVAAGKLPALLATGASITVVALDVHDEIARAPVTVHRRAFAASDLDGAWFVLAAATPEVNRWVGKAAEERRVFVNAVDDPGSASAYTGGVLHRGGVTIAVSTEGRAPALAGLLREGLEAVLPPEVGTWASLAHALRERQRRARTPLHRRRPALLEALNRLYAEKRAGADDPGAAREARR